MKDKKLIKEKKEELLRLTDEFCDRYLDKEYKKLCKKLIGKMALKKEVPFLSGKIQIWAASVIHVLGRFNFLYDESFEPYIKYDTLVEHFGTSKKTVTGKAKNIADMFNLSHFDKDFTTESLNKMNPFNEILDMFAEGFNIPVNSGGALDIENFNRSLEEYLGEDLDDYTEEEDEYPDEELDKICDVVYKWVIKFSKSPFYKKLREDEKNKSEDIIMNFTEFMHYQYGTTPEEWDEETVEECCIYTIPCYFLGEEAFFKAIGPVMTNFFAFLFQEKLLKNADRLIKVMEKVKDQIVKNAGNPAFWNPGKALVMRAQKMGVNIYDENELNEFIEKHKFEEKKVFTEKELVEKMEHFLPVPVFATKELCEVLNKQDINIRLDTPLKIENLCDSGDAEGIVCAIKSKALKNELLLISLNHLQIIPEHPISKIIKEYQETNRKDLPSHVKKTTAGEFKKNKEKKREKKKSR